MIDRSKISREVRRIVAQVEDALRRPVEGLRQRRHDRQFPGNLKIEAGNTRAGDKLALIVLYQPGGLARSTPVACRLLAEQGYGLVVVSNAPLSDVDREALRPYCEALIERPNLGYDFGAYRDGLRYLRHAGRVPETLLMLNDSIWFPVNGGSLLRRMEADPAPFQGTVFEKKPGRRARNAHFQSYLFLMRREVLEHPAFWTYWDDYPLSDVKRVVLRQGEKGFTQAMLAAGFATGLPSTRRLLFEALQPQTAGFLHKTLAYAAYEEADLLAEARSLLRGFDGSDAWRAQALDHFDRAVDRCQPMGSFCYACMHLFGFEFVKKSGYPRVHEGMRHQYLRGVEAGDLPAPPPEMLDEIRVSRRDPAMTTDPAFDPAADLVPVMPAEASPARTGQDEGNARRTASSHLPSASPHKGAS